ncbi:hypothetical protein HPPC_07100 [Helicobacter pylori PeCan4]|nr:hypothetical protein HPPC_07100 [Helicobacter pylori PeCan4]
MCLPNKLKHYSTLFVSQPHLKPHSLKTKIFLTPPKRDYLKNQMILGFQIPKLGSVFLSHKLQTFLKANAILNQTNA